ncbi:MAG: endospore germination permease [Clostridia bacterium]|nr:endospore germination permease [Clostridia bacterium]
MYKEQITDREAISMLLLFVIGSTLIIGIGGDAKNDAWIAGIAGILMALPIILVYSRISSLFPGKDLFDILTSILGKVFGKTVAVLYIWYAFHLGALVIRNFGEFINTVAMPETPMLVPMLCLGLVCIVAVRAGIEVLGRISTYLVFPLMAIIMIVQILAIPELKPNYIKPFLSQGIMPILKGGFSAFAFPFAETILFIAVFFSLKTKRSPYKVYFSGLSIAGVLILLLTIRNIMVLGDLLGRLYFPSHVAVSRINIGNFLERIEVSVAFVFIVGAFVKTGVCLFAACRGIGKVFNLTDYKPIVIQTGLLMIYFSYIVYDSIMEMRNWAFKVYPYYAFPFQVILPLVIWIAAEIKTRKKAKQC